MQNYVGGVNQANSAIMQAALASGDFNNQIADTGDILEEASDRQSRIISGITNTVSEIARNPVESIFSIGRLATRNVLSIAETTNKRCCKAFSWCNQDYW